MLMGMRLLTDLVSPESRFARGRRARTPQPHHGSPVGRSDKTLAPGQANPAYRYRTCCSRCDGQSPWRFVPPLFRFAGRPSRPREGGSSCRQAVVSQACRKQCREMPARCVNGFRERLGRRQVGPGAENSKRHTANAPSCQAAPEHVLLDYVSSSLLCFGARGLAT